jgi:uncharacterized protein (TIGR03437 family)
MVSKIIALTVLSGAFAMLRAATPPGINALWVYSVTSLPSPITDSPTRDTLLQNGSLSGVNMLYASVYSATPNSAGRFLYDESDIAGFIGKAHGQGMQVYAALGDPDWPSSGCTVSGTPYKRFSDIAGYDSANPTAKFDGIMLDVEPGSNPDFPSLLSLYQCFEQQSRAVGLGISAAINAFWNSTVTFNQVTEEAYKQIVDLKLNNLVVMGYRNVAGTLDCSQGDGVLCLDEDVIEYANAASVPTMILVGLKTDNPATAGDLPEETFYMMGQAAMNAAAQSVYSQLAAVNQSFGGFAINNYRDSYLNGQLPGWPAINPIPLALFPQFSAAGVVNAASFLSGSVAPGELISIFGQNLGPVTALGLQVSNGSVTTSLGGVQVLFNGIPAPIISAYSTQVNVIVPFQVQGPNAAIQLNYSGTTSALVAAPVISTAPGVFTANSAGTGPGAVLNQDYSSNNAGHPAAAGSVVILYLTGAGQTNPPGSDGLVNTESTVLAQPALPVTAQVGGLPATVAYAGNSVGIVSGVVQVNLVLPAGLASGPQPVVVRIGSANSQPGVTIAVQ